MNKCVVVSGGAGGIGKGIVKFFAENGFHVIVLDIKVDGLSDLEDSIKDNLDCIPLDVTDTDMMNRWKSSLPSDFSVDHVITLAGRALETEWFAFEKQPLSDLEKSVKINLLGHMNVIHTCLPFMKNSIISPSILMISSINAIGCFGLPAYSASKAGLYGFANAIVSELGAKNIRINVLSLGTVVTEMTQREPKDFDKLLKATPLKRFVSIDDVSKMAFQICVEHTSLTGQNIVLDAGQSTFHIDYNVL